MVFNEFPECLAMSDAMPCPSRPGPVKLQKMAYTHMKRKTVKMRITKSKRHDNNNRKTSQPTIPIAILK